MKDNNYREVYLDANFLVDLSVRKQSALKRRALILLAQFLSHNVILVISPLVIQEMWIGIRKEKDPQRQFSYANGVIFLDIQKFTKEILENKIISKHIKIIQLNNIQEGILKALNYLKEFQLEPRDAFHLSIMKDNGITTLVSRDEKFFNQQSQMGIEVIHPLECEI